MCPTSAPGPYIIGRASLQSCTIRSVASGRVITITLVDFAGIARRREQVQPSAFTVDSVTLSIYSRAHFRRLRRECHMEAGSSDGFVDSVAITMISVTQRPDCRRTPR